MQGRTLLQGPATGPSLSSSNAPRPSRVKSRIQPSRDGVDPHAAHSLAAIICKANLPTSNDPILCVARVIWIQITPPSCPYSVYVYNLASMPAQLDSVV
jgi:hypothetical protein